MNWILEDCEHRNLDAPETFEIPELKSRSGLRIGDMVKLIFIVTPEPPQPPTGERMWVEITEIVWPVKLGKGHDRLRQGEPRFTGILMNAPVVVDAKHGDEIQFAPCNVAAIQKKKAAAP